MWSHFESTWGDTNLGELRVIPIWVNKGWFKFGSTWGVPNLGQFWVIPIWVIPNGVNIRWSKFLSTWGNTFFGSTWGNPNMGQLGLIPNWVNLGWTEYVSTWGLSHFRSTWVDPDTGQLKISILGIFITGILMELVCKFRVIKVNRSYVHCTGLQDYSVKRQLVTCITTYNILILTLKP